MHLTLLLCRCYRTSSPLVLVDSPCIKYLNGAGDVYGLKCFHFLYTYFCTLRKARYVWEYITVYSESLLVLQLTMFHWHYPHLSQEKGVYSNKNADFTKLTKINSLLLC